MELAPRWVSIAAHCATIAAALVAALAFIVGLLQFNETQKMTRENIRLQNEVLTHEREAKAIEFYMKYHELKKAVSDKPLPKSSDPAFWDYNLLLVLTESIFRLTEGDEGWGKGVMGMLQSQKDFLEHQEQDCRTWAPRFLALMQQAAPAMRCNAT
jgi:hypothetical protein